jgi:phage gpG-like protein
MHVGSKPLIVTGQLEAVASSPSVWEVGEDYAQVSGLNGAEYGIVHQFGADTSGNGAIIPARPFIDIQDSDANAIEIIIDEWVAELLLAAGFVASVTGVGEDAGGLSGASN